MKVLIVNKFLYPNGGSETYIFGIGKQLAAMGHEVQYFGMEHPDRIVGNRVGCYTSNMDFHTGKLAKVFYPFRIIYSAEAARKIRKVLEDFSPDVVHLNNFNFQITPSVLYAIRRYEKRCGHRIRVVYTAHDYQLVCPNHLLMRPDKSLCERCLGGNPWNCAKYGCIHGSRIKSLLGSLEGWLYRRLRAYQKIDAVVCPSRFMEEKLSVHPDLAGKTVVMHNFVELPEHGERSRGEYVLYFGRFCEEKGIKTLLRVCRDLPQIPFVFAGSGPLEEEVSRLPNVENRGFLRGDALTETICRARFCVFPSEWYENCPFAVMETLAYETPILASDLGGTPELVIDRVTGELYPGKDEDALRQKVKALWEDPTRVEEYAGACRQVRFDTLESYCRKLLKVYGEE